MKIRLNDYKVRATDSGKHTSNAEIAAATGIAISTIDSISAGRVKEIRLEYLDALSTYFARLLGVDVSNINLVDPDVVELPLALNMQAERGSRRVGSPRPNGGQRDRHANERIATQPSLSEFTALASEEVLAQEWLTQEEDEAWADL